MGDYLTQATLKERFDSDRELAYLTGDEDSGTPASNDLDDAIEWAEGVINVHVAMRYLTPVSSTEATVTAFLKRLTGDLAEYHLRSRKPPVSDTTQAKYDQALAVLSKLADGDLVLPGATTPTSAASRDPQVKWTGSNRTLLDTSARIFTRDLGSRL